MITLLGGKSVTSVASDSGLSEQEIGLLSVWSPGLVHKFAVGVMNAPDFLVKSQRKKFFF